MADNPSSKLSEPGTRSRVPTPEVNFQSLDLETLSNLLDANANSISTPVAALSPRIPDLPPKDVWILFGVSAEQMATSIPPYELLETPPSYVCGPLQPVMQQAQELVSVAPDIAFLGTQCIHLSRVFFHAAVAFANEVPLDTKINREVLNVCLRLRILGNKLQVLFNTIMSHPTEPSLGYLSDWQNSLDEIFRSLGSEPYGGQEIRQSEPVLQNLRKYDWRQDDALRRTDFQGSLDTQTTTHAEISEYAATGNPSENAAHSTIQPFKVSRTIEKPQPSPQIGPKAIERGRFAGVSSPFDAVRTLVQEQDLHEDSDNYFTTITPTQKSARSISRPRSVTGSASGADGKFSLKYLLGGRPTRRRRSSGASINSGRSGGSGRSGSEKEDGRSAKTFAARYSAALEHKYGRFAMNNDAVYVVKLAHKWGATENKLYAVKKFRPRRNKEAQRDYVKKLTSEFCISSVLQHSNVQETVDLLQDKKGEWWEIIEFCTGGTLSQAIRQGGMSPAAVECCFKQILMGVGYLHSQGVAHRDIQPENLFFDAKGQIKIGDFGAITVFRLPWETIIHKSSGLCGSEPYIAPEQFSQPNSYDARLVDIWACGIVYYCLYFQELPWSSAQTIDKTYSQYAHQCASPGLSIAGVPSLEGVTPYPPTIRHLSPRACRPLLRRMLEPSPDLRIGIEDILKHPWVTQIEVCTEPGVTPKHIHPVLKGP